MTLNTILCKHYSNGDNEVTLGSFLYNLVKYPYMRISPFVFPVVLYKYMEIGLNGNPAFDEVMFIKFLLLTVFFMLGAVCKYVDYFMPILSSLWNIKITKCNKDGKN